MSTMQISMLIGSIATLVFILYTAKKAHLDIHYTIVWILWALCMIFFSLFPSVIDWIARVLSIAIPVNALFLILIFFLYIISFYLFLRLTEQAEKIKTLTYEVAELKKKNDEIKK